MPKKITALTPEQQVALPQCRELWRKVGLCTDPIHSEAARAAVRALYVAGGLPEPKAVFVLSSPMMALLARGAVMRLLGKEIVAGGDQLGDQLWGQLRGQLRGQLWELREHAYFIGGQDAYWLALYDFAREIGVKYGESTDAHLLAYKDYALRCGWMYAYKEIAFVSDRPAEIHFDAALRLHSDSGMAVRFRDGWGLCAWHGLRLPPEREWIVAPDRQFNPDKIDAEENAEFRRVMLEQNYDGRSGLELYMAARDAKLIHRDELHGQPRELLEINVRAERIRVVRVVNGSDEPDGSRRSFVLGAARRGGGQVQPVTAHDAIAASYGINPDRYKEAVRS